MKSIRELRESDVGMVYSGKPGCGCGCLGKYWTQPRWAKVTAQRRGYELDEEEIQLRQVRRILKIMQDRFDEVKTQTNSAGEIIYSIETEDRYWWLFVFTNEKIEALKDLVEDLELAKRAAVKVSALLPCESITRTIEDLASKAHGYEVQLYTEIEMLGKE